MDEDLVTSQLNPLRYTNAAAPFHDGQVSINHSNLAEQVANIDLNLDPQSPLAVSVQQIAQGVMGSLFSENGGFNTVLGKRDIDMNHEFRITGLQQPNYPSDAANKQYVDNLRYEFERLIEIKIDEHFMLNHSKPQYEENSIEALKERVSNFSLFKKE